MRVRFIGLTGEAQAYRVPRPETPVARFQLEDGTEALVPAGKLHPFRDLRFLHWPPRLRARAVQALCAPVREADWDEAAGALDLAGRFRVAPDVDEPAWTLQGFCHLQTVDLKIIKHVLGAGSGSAGAVGWWSRTLDLPIAAGALLEGLEALGCTAWRALCEEPDADAVQPASIYPETMSRTQRLGCLELLAPIRERYLEQVRDAVTLAGRLRTARHAHLGAPSRRTMHFLDDRGLLTIAMGSGERLYCATAYLVLQDGEEGLTERALQRRWARLLKDVRPGLPFPRIHSPLRWRSIT